jgi:threonylcarbamoyladenosine tRNA methylthiotransferase MtaB
VKKVLIHTLGCKTNQYDSQAMLTQLRAAGYEPAGPGDQADAVIINTCTVTAEADRKSRQMIRQAVSSHPGAVVVVAGCYAQRDPAKLASILGVDLVIGNAQRAQIAQWIEKARASKAPLCRVDSLEGAGFEPLTISAPGEHTRANIKIQEGCNRFCTYCIIPSVRGPIRSRPMADTVAEVKRLAALDVKEFVLTGIHIASYGLDLPGGTGLIDLLEALDAVPGMGRLRLGSLEPALLTEDFCRRAAGLGHLCHHFHLSLQSGCTQTLRRMGRRYTAEKFAQYAQRLRRFIPDSALTTDIIVGFPQESDEDFETSMAFVEEMAFSRIHVFPFSPREGTAAARMAGQIDKSTKHQRARAMIALGQRLQQEAALALVGTRQWVLVEEEERGMAAGYTPGYQRVLLPGTCYPAGTLTQVYLERAEEGLLFGRPVEQEDVL